MRFTRLILDNYIGIYNGMGLTHIDIDMSICRHRILIIRGENGSGKSTIFNAMTVLPDGNDMFIPGQSAQKVIELLDGPVLYKMTFIHPTKANGTRDTTKAYLCKIVNGQTIELNPNGNVTSYKDILYDELGLDPNFIALSQLSTDDKGLASKKPAERKKFVNSIMSSLEVYNNIYKSLVKKSTAVKSLMQTISTRLGTLGEPQVLQSNLKSIEDQINIYNDKKDQATKTLMSYTARKELLDPDGSIQSKHSTLSSQLASMTKRLYSLYDKLNLTIFDPMSTLAEQESLLADMNTNRQIVLNSMKNLQTEYSNAKETILDLEKQKELKKESIKSISDEDNFEEICDMIAESEAVIADLDKQIKVSGIEPGSFTRDEYVIALNVLMSIKEAVNSFRKACSSADAMMEVIEIARNHDRVSLRDTDQYQAKIDAYINRAPALNEFILSCDSNIEKLKQLNDRPANCINDSCIFIADLIALRDSDIAGQRARAARELNELEICYEDAKVQLARAQEFNMNAGQLNNLLRLITINGGVLVRLPHGAIYKDKITFIEALIANEDFSYIDDIYKYIDLANLFDEYNAEKLKLSELQRRHDLYLSKSDVLGTLNSELENISTRLYTYTDKSEDLQKQILLDERELGEIDRNISTQTKICEMLRTCTELYKSILSTKQDMESLLSKMADITVCDRMIKESSDTIMSYTKMMAPLYNERDKVMHSLEMIEDYHKDLAVIQEQFNLIETVKYYSSPTSGIQLVFMELYMGKILGLANELLSLLFNGKYVIQPFIINESEFRIPCLGDGYINDDISSMSSAQISMISMILGFALLHNSSTKYNIIKLDEIDGPLDENNRILFIDLLGKIMDIMKTEQCILISHNSELNMDDADLIILKSTNLSTDYNRGNVIWRY